MVASGTGVPSLADVEILSAPDGVTLPRIFFMARGQWLRTRLIVGTCFGVDHDASDGLKAFGEEILERETELEEYIPRNTALRPPDIGAHPPACEDPLVGLARRSVGKEI